MAEKQSPPYLQYALLAAGVGGVAYLVLRPRPSSAAPSLPTTSPATTIPTAAPSVPSVPSVPVDRGNDPFLALVSRLRNNAQARKIYYLQATLYSNYISNDAPDGLQGPRTAEFVRAIQRHSTPATDTDLVTDEVLSHLLRYILWLRGNDRNVRVVPTPLPQDVIDAVNLTARRADQDLPLLQAQT